MSQVVEEKKNHAFVMHPRKILSERAQRRFEIKAFAQINVKMFKKCSRWYVQSDGTHAHISSN